MVPGITPPPLTDSKLNYLELGSKLVDNLIKPNQVTTLHCLGQLDRFIVSKLAR